MRPIA